MLIITRIHINRFFTYKWFHIFMFYFLLKCCWHFSHSTLYFFEPHQWFAKLTMYIAQLFLYLNTLKRELNIRYFYMAIIFISFGVAKTMVPYWFVLIEFFKITVNFILLLVFQMYSKHCWRDEKGRSSWNRNWCSRRKANDIYISNISNDVIMLTYDNSTTLPPNTPASYIRSNGKTIKRAKEHIFKC